MQMKSTNLTITAKAILVILCLCMALSSFAACKNSGKDTPSSSGSSSNTSSDVSSDTSSTIDETSDESSDTANTDSEPPAVEEDYIVPVTVHNSVAPVMNNFMGVGSAIYQLYTYVPDQFGRNFTEKQAQAQFDRMQDIGINYIRSYYNSWEAFDTNTKTFNYDNANMQGIYKECKELGKRGITVAITTGWSLHALTDDSSSIPSPEIYKKDNFDQTVKNHTKWMIDSLKQMRAHGVTNVKDLVLFTEPGKVQYTNDKMYGEFDAWLKLVKSLNDGLVAEGMRQDYRFIGPNQANNGSNGVQQENDDNASFLRFALKNADKYVDIYSSHNYPNSSSLTNDTYGDQIDTLWGGKFMQAMKDYKSKKPFWIDEWNVQEAGTNLNVNIPWRATQEAVAISRTMNIGISNTILWSLFDQQWPNNRGSGGEFVDGVQVCGIAPSLQISTIPTTQYYGYTLMSKYITSNGHGSTYLCETPYGDGIYVAMSKNENGDITLLVINVNWETTKFQVDFAKSLGVKLYRHMYNPTTIVSDTRGAVLPADRAYNTVKSRLVDQLPAGAVAVYTTIKG